MYQFREIWKEILKMYYHFSWCRLPQQLIGYETFLRGNRGCLSHLADTAGKTISVNQTLLNNCILKSIVWNDITHLWVIYFISHPQIQCEIKKTNCTSSCPVFQTYCPAWNSCSPIVSLGSLQNIPQPDSASYGSTGLESTAEIHVQAEIKFSHV